MNLVVHFQLKDFIPVDEWIATAAAVVVDLLMCPTVDQFHHFVDVAAWKSVHQPFYSIFIQVATHCFVIEGK